MTVADCRYTRHARGGDTVPAPRRAPVHARVVKGLLRRVVRDMPIQVRMPDGTVLGSPAPHAPTMVVHDDRFFDRVGRHHKIGVGEGYLAGEWAPSRDTDLADLLTPFAERLADIVPGPLRRLRRLAEAGHPAAEDNDRAGARSNISRHYDLSNDFFALFLDETMTYSAARFDQASAAAGFAGLAAAQRRKVEGILDDAQVGAGTRLLEIGTGWGQLAIQAADRGARVDTVTLSGEQLALARERIRAAGHADAVSVRLQDYRDVDGRYDAVVSVEMIEAVGERYWPAYFRSVSERLSPAGRFGLQAITMSHRRMLESRLSYGWVHKYVFPGGLIPSVEAITDHAGRAGLHIVGSRSLGPDYARTLRLWRERFDARRDLVLALGFDQQFLRVWEFYLAYSEAGFRSGHLDVRQLALVKQ